MDPSHQRPLRVAVVDHTAALSGAEIALLRLVRALDGQRARPVGILFSAGPLVDQLRRSGCPVEMVTLDPRVVHAGRHHIGRLSSVSTALASVSHLWRLRRRLRQLEVDVVHTNSLKSGVIGGIAARLAGKPQVWYVHDRITDDYLGPRTAGLMRWAIRRLPRQVLANSVTTLATLGPLPAGRHAVAHPGLDRSAFAISPRTDPPDRPTVGIIGRISPTKGQDVFLRAAALVQRTHPDVGFVVVGSALFNEQDFEAEVRALAGDLGLSDTVRFTGYVEDPRAEMEQCTVVVHASPVPEPFGQVVVEAMAAGIPVIATDAGGVTDILHGDLGLLVPPGDEQALAGAIRQIIDHPDQAAERSARALASARRRFTIEETADVVSTAWERASR